MLLVSFFSRGGGWGVESLDLKVPTVQVKFLFVPPFKPEWNPCLSFKRSSEGCMLLSNSNVVVPAIVTKRYHNTIGTLRSDDAMATKTSRKK